MKRFARFAFVLALAQAAVAAGEPVEWLFPRLGTCHEGLAFSDGVTGVLVWGGGSEIRLTVGRADLWDHRGGYPWTAEQSYTNIVRLVQEGRKDDLLSLFQNEEPAGWNGRYNPYMLPLARVVITLTRGEKLVRGELDPHTGLGKLVLSDGQSIGLAMSRESRLFAMRFPVDLAYDVETRHCMEFEGAGRILRARGFPSAKKWRDERNGASGGLSWTLPADQPVSLAWRRCGDDFVLATARGEAAATANGGYAAVRDQSAGQWKAFWEKGAKVQVPDPAIQRIFDYGMYRFGAMTDPDGIPAGLQGPWLEDDKLVPWNGDYHFNINVQECYSPAYRGGHFENLMPLFRMVLSWRPRLRENAKKFVGIDDGYVLPHSVDDRGVCIGGFWTGTIDHASTAWVAAMMMKYVRYSGDIEFLKNDAYDFMKGAMHVYRAMMEEVPVAKTTGDAESLPLRLSIPLGPSPEWGSSDVRHAVGRDPSFQLAAAHRLARDLIDAAKLLKCEADAAALEIEKRLPAYTASDPNVGIDLFEGQHFVDSHRHHSHMAGFYPFDTIDMTKDQRTLERTYHTWIMRGTGQWTGWCVPWASILHTHVGNSYAAVRMLQDWDYYFCNPGHGSHHDGFVHGFTVFGRGGYGPIGNEVRHDVMQMDGACAAATAVMELLVHEVNGKVEFFKGCPPEWKEVSFENVALSDGRRVSGHRIGGAPFVTYK